MSLASRQVGKNGLSPRIRLADPVPSSSATITYKGTTLTLEILEITPEMAANLLEKNIPKPGKRNRPVRPKTLARYTKIMKERRWVLNGETIVVDQEGRPYNGQHRLSACVESGESFVTLLVRVQRGIEWEEAFPTYDQGTIRSAGDCLAIEGGKNVQDLGAALVLYWRHLQKKNTHISLYPEKHELVDFSHKHPGMADSVSYAQAFRKLTSKSLVAFCHYAFSKQDVDRASQFFEGLRTGASLKAESPILVLRNRLTSEASKKSRLPISELVALFFKAWIAYRDNKPMKSLRWNHSHPNPEAFPSID